MFGLSVLPPVISVSAAVPKLSSGHLHPGRQVAGNPVAKTMTVPIWASGFEGGVAIVAGEQVGIFHRAVDDQCLQGDVGGGALNGLAAGRDLDRVGALPTRLPKIWIVSMLL